MLSSRIQSTYKISLCGSQASVFYVEVRFFIELSLFEICSIVEPGSHEAGIAIELRIPEFGKSTRELALDKLASPSKLDFENQAASVKSVKLEFSKLTRSWNITSPKITTP